MAHGTTPRAIAFILINPIEGFPMTDTVIRLVASNEREGKVPPPLTPAEKAKRDARFARAFLRLETEIRDAEHMARIAYDRLQETFGRPPSLNGREPDDWYIPEGTAETDLFAVGHVLDLLVDLRQKYHAAFDQPQQTEEEKS
jgi:hypothetical protein